jgi:hypothetical protein
MLPPPGTLLVASEFVDPCKFFRAKRSSAEKGEFQSGSLYDCVHDDQKSIFFNLSNWDLELYLVRGAEDMYERCYQHHSSANCPSLIHGLAS